LPFRNTTTRANQRQPRKRFRPTLRPSSGANCSNTTANSRRRYGDKRGIHLTKGAVKLSAEPLCRRAAGAAGARWCAPVAAWRPEACLASTLLGATEEAPRCVLRTFWPNDAASGPSNRPARRGDVRALGRGQLLREGAHVLQRPRPTGRPNDGPSRLAVTHFSLSSPPSPPPRASQPAPVPGGLREDQAPPPRSIPAAEGGHDSIQGVGVAIHCRGGT